MRVPPVLTRRTLLYTSFAAAAVRLLPNTADAQGGLINPYSGSLPLTFPLEAGTYRSPVKDNWHEAREGQPNAWSHRTDPATRAHDGVDVYPVADQSPRVYAPFAGIVAAVCVRSANRIDATVRYRFSRTTPPPWDYSQAADEGANLPLYGNFIWLISTEPASAGYFVCFAHLQNETAINQLVPDQHVTTASPLGLVGDTGNAAGTPQLHVELHYPAGVTFGCGRCVPVQSLTAIDATASLTAATPRAAAGGSTSPATAGSQITYPVGWNLVAAPSGTRFSQATGPLYTFQAQDSGYEVVSPTSPLTSGFGYWAYFTAATSVSLAGAGADSAQVPAPAGQFVMVGNPSVTRPATVRNADAVWTYDATARSYVATTTLQPGQGAWAMSVAGATIRVSTGA